MPTTSSPPHSTSVSAPQLPRPSPKQPVRTASQESEHSKNKIPHPPRCGIFCPYSVVGTVFPSRMSPKGRHIACHRHISLPEGKYRIPQGYIANFGDMLRRNAIYCCAMRYIYFVNAIYWPAANVKRATTGRPYDNVCTCM